MFLCLDFFIRCCNFLIKILLPQLVPVVFLSPSTWQQLYNLLTSKLVVAMFMQASVVRIGCVGNQVHFRNSGKQVHAVQVIVKNNSQNLLSANSRVTVAQLSADYWPTDGQLSANSLCYD